MAIKSVRDTQTEFDTRHDDQPFENNHNLGPVSRGLESWGEYQYLSRGRGSVRVSTACFVARNVVSKQVSYAYIPFSTVDLPFSKPRAARDSSGSLESCSLDARGSRVTKEAKKESKDRYRMRGKYSWTQCVKSPFLFTCQMRTTNRQFPYAICLPRASEPNNHPATPGDVFYPRPRPRRHEYHLQERAAGGRAFSAHC